jgi:hypothetical protein
MSGKSDFSDVSRRQFLAVAGGVAAASSLGVGENGSSAQASPLTTPVHYLVTIDVTSGSPLYSAIDQGTHLPVSLSNHNRDLSVNPGDSVKWQVITKITPSDPTPVHRTTILFLAGC